MTPTAARFTLRQLPLPAKLVLSCFLVAVGLGYFSALVQLHMQHSSRNGEHLPTPADVVEIFAGKKKADPSLAGVRPVSKLEKLVMGPVEGAPWNGSGSMAAAFFHKDGAGYSREVKKNPDIQKEREGERAVVRAWVNAPDVDREKAYEADTFPLPPELVGKPVTADYLANNGGAAKVKTLLADRCVRCHGKDGAQANYPLETYAQLLKYMDVPPVEAPVDGWVKSDRQVSIEKLTQSTHAHLLTFAVLFTLTGLTFAFSSYSTGVRCLLAPLVLVAQVVDVACWWLARIDGPGVYFATAIIGTGGIVGLGLAAQIVLGLFDLYGPKGKAVVFLVLALGAAALGVVYKSAIVPALQAQRDALLVKKEEKPAEPAKAAEPAAVKPAEPKHAEIRPTEPKPTASVTAAVDPPKTVETPQPSQTTATAPAPMPRPAVGDARRSATPAAAQPPSQLERLIMGPVMGAKWDGSKQGSMAAAFFHKDEGNEYKKAIKDDPGSKDKLDAERNGERAALQAWIRSNDASRKAAYTADLLPLPRELAGKPLTAAYAANGGTAAKVKSILADRCGRCHAKGLEQEDHPLETYEQLLKYLGPEKE